MLPKKKPKPHVGLHALRREFHGHRAWVRGHCCCVPGCDGSPIEFAHARMGVPPSEAGGTGLKPHDKWGLSLCKAHHAEQHAIGEQSFSEKYHISLIGLAKDFARQSPHRWRWENAA